MLQQPKPLGVQNGNAHHHRASDSGSGIPISSVDFKLEGGLRIEEAAEYRPTDADIPDEDSDDFSGARMMCIDREFSAMVDTAHQHCAGCAGDSLPDRRCWSFWPTDGKFIIPAVSFQSMRGCLLLCSPEAGPA